MSTEEPSRTPSASAAAPPREDLADLLAEIAGGSEAALGRLYDASVGRAWSVALRIVRKPEAAQEVVEDTYFQLWREAGRYDPDRGGALTWILTICRSRALDHLRRADPAESHPDPDSLRDPAALAQGDDPLDILSAVERESAVHAALARLDPQARQLVALAFFRGLSHQEIADAARMPLGSVKTVLQRAFRQLRGWLADEGVEVYDA
jgi:RNA polymerase sigma-70 factor (ECF subfamily)